LLEDAFEDPSTRPDLIVSDACMPHLSGLGVLEAMKRAHISVPMLIMTGFVPPSVGVVARRLGGLGVLSKPFDVNALRIAVARAAAGNSTW
jgi:DNA-binding NtrC family response regulator